MSATTDIQIANDARGAHSLRRLVRHLDLFSGIGGFALACEMVGGIKTIGFSEIEPYACTILKQNWPDVPNHGDIRNVRGIACELITGGFPCQPFSVSGKRLGKEDDRHLWPEMLRIIDEARPTWVLGENVAGIVSMELDRVLSDLENLGYACWPLVIPACAADAKHRRDRVWIMAHSAQRQDDGRKCGKLDEAARCRKGQHAAPDARREALADVCSGNARTRMESATGASERHESWRKAEMPSADGGQGDARRNARNRADIRRGEVAIWQPEPGVGRMAHGVSNRPHRLKGLGNAIVPQVAAEIIRTMMRVAQMSNNRI